MFKGLSVILRLLLSILAGMLKSQKPIDFFQENQGQYSLGIFPPPISVIKRTGCSVFLVNESKAWRKVTITTWQDEPTLTKVRRECQICWKAYQSSGLAPGLNAKIQPPAHLCAWRLNCLSLPSLQSCLKTHPQHFSAFPGAGFEVRIPAACG